MTIPGLGINVWDFLPGSASPIRRESRKELVRNFPAMQRQRALLLRALDAHYNAVELSADFNRWLAVNDRAGNYAKALRDLQAAVDETRQAEGTAYAAILEAADKAIRERKLAAGLRPQAAESLSGPALLIIAAAAVVAIAAALTAAGAMALSSMFESLQRANSHQRIAQDILSAARSQAAISPELASAVLNPGGMNNPPTSIGSGIASAGSAVGIAAVAGLALWFFARRR
jgi:hypothetical protein